MGWGWGELDTEIKKVSFSASDLLEEEGYLPAMERVETIRHTEKRKGREGRALERKQ